MDLVELLLLRLRLLLLLLLRRRRRRLLLLLRRRRRLLLLLRLGRKEVEEIKKEMRFWRDRAVEKGVSQGAYKRR